MRVATSRRQCQPTRSRAGGRKLRQANSLVEVEFQLHDLVLVELHDEVRVPRLSLPDRRVDIDDELGVDVVGFGKEEEALHLLVRDAVVVRLAAQAHEVGVDVDVCGPGAR